MGPHQMAPVMRYIIDGGRIILIRQPGNQSLLLNRVSMEMATHPMISICLLLSLSGFYCCWRNFRDGLNGFEYEQI